MKGIEMISVEDLINCCRAAELLYNGVDVSKIDNLKMYFNQKTKQLQEKYSPNVGKFVLKLEQDTKDYIGWDIGDFMVRDNSTWYTVSESSLAEDEKTVNTSLDADSFKKIMCLLKRKGMAVFSGFAIETYDTDYVEHIKELKKTWNRKDHTGCELITELAHDKVEQNLHVLLTLSQYRKELAEQILDKYDNPDKKCEISGYEDYEVIDGRVYIKVAEWEKDILRNGTGDYNMDSEIANIKYIVISQNPYDYYFCSYGANIQSCFSLNSSHGGWYGMVAMSAARGNYIVYGTTDKPNKINIINGKKWSVPRMLFRCWAWLDKDNVLRLDRLYYGNEYANVASLLRKFIAQYFQYDDDEMNLRRQETKLKYADEMSKVWKDNHCHFYPDSIKVEDFKFHGVCQGNREFKGSNILREPLLNLAHEINEVPAAFKYSERYVVIGGVISSEKTCPKTGLPIKDDETVSPYAKYFKEPVTKVFVATFCDGYFKGDLCFSKRIDSGPLLYSSRVGDYTSSDSNPDVLCFGQQFSTKKLNIKAFKERITGVAKKTTLDAILVRYIEGERVTVVKYRGNSDEKTA